MASRSETENQEFFAGGGEMGERTRNFDWSQTPLGPIPDWPQSLKIAVRIMLDSRYAMWLGWGPDFIFFYNDAYAQMTLGPKHPWALGRSAREVWPEIWSDVGPRAESVVRTGQATWDEGLMLVLERRGFPEETYHTFSYSPIRSDARNVGGMLCVVIEDTERTIGERRLRALRELAARTTVVTKSAEDACRIAAQTLADDTHDLPFLLIYLLDGETARLAGTMGLAEGSLAAPEVIDLSGSIDERTTWPLATVLKSGKAEVVKELGNRFGPLPGGPWPNPAESAVVMPVTRAGQSRLGGFVIAGLSPRLEFNEEYQGFLDLLTNQIAGAVTNARAYEEERRRAEALAELDQAKTAFFSNVSHEFRTPLTLMLGPVEELLARSHENLPPAVKSELEIVNRNGARLLRLVNSLLDFSRIEAGRIRAVYQPTDLAAFTGELVSVFRSACERAGIRLVVDCPPLEEMAFVDREMWEKIVLNLVSNAFKFTFTGEIAVSIRKLDNTVELQVRDTGTGVPAEEMPRLFERFHRVENARGRTHEGSGIGLALVQELVKLHGGSVTAQSKPGHGTTFFVSVPLGSAHLPADQIVESQRGGSMATTAIPFVEEALRWLPDELPRGQPELPPHHELLPVPRSRIDEGNDQRPRVLVADDNADMRQYIVRLLSEHYCVDAVPDGEAAMAMVRDRPPELILTDVMMPKLDGFGLLKQLRADPRISSLPVIMLSARAGEESRVEGMESGADDYLVKPFSARELLARVGAHIQINRLRRESEQAIRLSEERFRVLFETMNEGFAIDEVIFDESGRPCDLRYLEVNPGFERHTGLKRSEILNRTMLEVFPDAENYWIERFGRVVTSRVAEHFQAKFGPLDRWFEVSAYRTGPKHLATVFFDITDRKHAEEDARDARSRLESSLAAGEIGTWEFDIVHDRVRADHNLARMFGVTIDEADGGPLEAYMKAIHTEDRARVEETIGTAIQGGDGFETEYRLVAAEGTIRWVIARGRVMRDDSGRAVSMPGVIVDITAQRTAEQRERQLAVEASTVNAKYQALFEQGPLFAGVMALDGTLLEANQLSLNACGYTRADVIGKPFWECPWWNRSTALMEQIKTASKQAATGKLYRAEMPYFVADGSQRIVDLIVHPIKDEDGRVLFLAPTGNDITDQKRAEESLRASEERRRLALDAAELGAWNIDPKTNALTSDERFQIIFSGMVGSFDYERAFALIHPDDRNRVRDAVAAAVNPDNPVPYSEEYRVVHPADSAVRWVFAKGRASFEESGSERRVVSFDGTVADVTERKQLEEHLRRLAADLSEAGHRKDEFLATLAHELRNPLAPIRNGLQLMQLAAGNEAAVDEARTMMERQLTQLVRLVDDLMDVSRINQGKIELRTELLPLASVINSAVETSRPLIDEMQHQLTISLPSTPILVSADMTRLAQVFMNLLNNAAKYSDRGSRIWVTAEKHATEAIVSVRDNGIGIAADQLPRIFEMFSQVDRSLEKSQGGLGIGLSLVKRLVEMHGGRIEAMSDGPGHGSEFVVRLPIVAQSADVQSPTHKDTGDPTRTALRVLIVDDNRDGANSLALMLKVLGNDTRTAYDGEEAVAKALEFQPSVILLDIGLPKLNGYEACRRIREQPGGKDIIIIAQTGWGQDEDRQRTRDAGFDHHLVKPVESTKLMSLLAGLRSTTQS